MSKNPQSRAPDLAVAVVAAAVAAVLLWRLEHPLGIRPDSWSEAEVVVSGWGYARSGFLAFAGLPQHQVGPPVDPYFLYANYPPLPNLIFGVLHRSGADAHGLYRLPAILASLLALAFWYGWVARRVDRGTGAAATAALGTSLGFLAYADHVHQQAYPLAPLFGALWCSAIATAPETRRRGRWWAGCGACVAGVSLVTVEWHLWLALAFLGQGLLFRPAVRWRWLAAALLPLAAGVAVQGLQGALGSPWPAEERAGFADSLYRRSLGFEVAEDTPFTAAGERLTMAGYPAFLAERFQDFYGLPIWALAALGLVAFAGVRRPGRRPEAWPPAVRLAAVLLVAGLGWPAVMMQQTAVHVATMRQLLPFYALVLGVAWVQAVRALRGRLGLRPRWRALLAALAVATLVPHLRGGLTNLRMHADPDYRNPTLMSAGWRESADLRGLADLPAGSVVLTNYDRGPLLRYWSRRPVYLAPNRGAGTAERTHLDLMLGHLRGLYAGGLPPLVYLYRIPDPSLENVQRFVDADPLLRLLATGRPERPSSPEARLGAALAVAGQVPAASPIVARGGNWRCFDMEPVLPALLGSPLVRPEAPRPRDLPSPR